MEKTYDFDDVLIKPVPSTVSSRDNVDISVKLSDDLTLGFPLIASPMPGVADGAFAKKLSDLGGLAIFHRFYADKMELFNDIIANLTIDVDKFGFAIKIGEENLGTYLQFHPSILLIDTANGYTKRLVDYCTKVKDYIMQHGYKTLLMAGNVVTPQGCMNLFKAGCDIIRVGIGGGAVCSTRNKTGIGIPNISAIFECASFDYKIVIDGGIKNSGDLVKSIVAGADLGMSGMLFAECYESPNEGELNGGASRRHMEKNNINIKSVEGFTIPIVKKHSLEQFVREFGFGIKSAGTYLNARSLNEIYTNGEFVEVSDHAIKKGL